MTAIHRAAATLLVISSIAAAQSGNPKPKFTNSYGLDVGQQDGGCLFFLTDTGMSAAEVTATLKEGDYDTARGLEVLVTETTPRKCGELGRKAALKAGFKAVRVRLATHKDRWQRP
jgi:hypothetical protein